jgi:hypothetical protein
VALVVCHAPSPHRQNAHNFYCFFRQDDKLTRGTRQGNRIAGTTAVAGVIPDTSASRNTFAIIGRLLTGTAILPMKRIGLPIDLPGSPFSGRGAGTGTAATSDTISRTPYLRAPG